jgi:hypothetical protein
MKTKLLISVLAILALVASTSVTLWAQQSPSRQPALEKQKQPPTTDTKKASQPSPVYKPPQLGAPGGRVGGGTRGIGGDALSLVALAPNHVGLTTQAQPTFYWYLSGTPNFPLIFTLIEYKAVKPLVEKQITMPAKDGIYGISLKEYGISLEPGTTYRWFVSIVPDQDRRAKDLVAGAMIELASPSEALNAKVHGSTDRVKTAYAYAEEGIWYDALMALSDAIDSNPGNVDLQQQRITLLNQVGIDGVK